MSQDAKNSIFLWAGTLVFVGLFWAALHFDIGPDIPDSWLGPMLAIVIGANVVRSAWDYFSKRRGNLS